jgi:NADPH-dependent 2,4-dienoyl-CoA reductase/sulfur reductase-like enzyme
METTDVAVLGAGPHGLAAAAQLRRAGVDTRVMGDPMSFWRSMPIGMMLRSNWTASCIAEYDGPLSLDAYCAATGTVLSRPSGMTGGLPLDSFLAYGAWVQRHVAPDVDRRRVTRLALRHDAFTLRLEDGDEVLARRVVVAAGIAPFTYRPGFTEGLPRELASHSADHRDLSRFAGRRVVVLGGGQSALESAALLRETGAEVEVVVRKDHINWLHGGRYHRRLGRLAPLVYAPTDVGPMGLSRLVAVPDLFRRLPREVQEPLAGRSIRPAGAAWLRPRLTDVPIRLSRSVALATAVGDRVRIVLDDGEVREADHLLLGTGYRVDIARYPFLAQDLVPRIARAGGYPVLRPGLESSVPGLHFVGAPAAWSFGPTMRFVAGGWYAGRAVVRAVTGHEPHTRNGSVSASIGEAAA